MRCHFLVTFAFETISKQNIEKESDESANFFGSIVAATITILTPSLIQAQTTIEDLQSSNDMTISGEVTSVVGNNFILDDGTGEIIVDAGPRWWREIALSPGERATVTGEMERGGEFDAFTITRADDNTMEIRSPEGLPPWAGGPNRVGETPPRR